MTRLTDIVPTTRYGKKPRAAFGQATHYCHCGVKGFHHVLEEPSALNYHEEEPCRVLLVHDTASDEVFAVCHHGAVSPVLHPSQINAATRKSPAWAWVPRPYEKALLFETARAAGPEVCVVLAEWSAPAPANVRRG